VKCTISSKLYVIWRKTALDTKRKAFKERQKEQLKGRTSSVAGKELLKGK